MRIGSLFVALAFASQATLPGVALAQFGEAWRSSPPGGYRLYGIADYDGNGSMDFLTGESPDFDGEHIGVRSAATGALQAQSVVRYEASNVFAADLDGDGAQEILFLDNVTGKQTCLTYAGPPGPLALRWTIRPFAGAGPFAMFFADLDGNGHPYVVFQAQSSDDDIEVYTNMGALFGAYTPNRPLGWVLEYLGVLDLDGDGRDEILLMYFDPSGFALGRHLIMLESTAPVAVGPRPDGLRAIDLGASFPNPATTTARIDYTLPSGGPVTLRLLDVAGRELRVLVDGQVTAGRHEAVWDGRDAHGRRMPAGTYFYELSAGSQRLARRMVRLP